MYCYSPYLPKNIYLINSKIITTYFSVSVYSVLINNHEKMLSSTIVLYFYSLVEMGASRAPPGIFNETNFF